MAGSVLYNGYVALGNIAPVGFHVPTEAELLTLAGYFTDPTTEAGKLKTVGTEYWEAPNLDATNALRFNAKGSGNRSGVDGSFVSLTTLLDIWTRSESLGIITVLTLTANDPQIYYWAGRDIKTGCSIRCIKDSTILSHGQDGQYLDQDGNVIRTICIGTQEWMSEDLRVTHYNDGTPIQNITDATAWIGLTTGAMCYYNNDFPFTLPVPTQSSISGLADFNEPFNVMYSVGDIRELSFGSSNKSYTLNIPLTKLNKKLLKFINQTDVKSEPSEIVTLTLDEQVVISGKMIVLSVDEYYAKVIINQDDWMDDLKNKKMSELDLSDYNHALTHANIEASWTAVYPMYRYPMINFGHLASGEQGPTAKWYPNDFIPMISVAQLITKIFEGYLVVSEWLNLAYIKDLFILAKETIAADTFIRGKQLNVAVSTDFNNTNTSSLPAETSGNSLLNNVNVLFNTSTVDEGADFSTYEYVVPESGTYKFKVALTLLNNAYGDSDFTITYEEVTVSIIRKRGVSYDILGTISAAAYTGTELIQNIEYEVSSEYKHLLAGDEVFVQLYLACNATNNSLAPKDLTVGVKAASTFENIWNSVNRYSGIDKIMSLEEMLPDMTQLDFLAAIRDIVNQRYWMDKTNKSVHTEPWDQFLSNEVIDISDFVDYDSIQTEMISPNFNQAIDFRWKNDSSDQAYVEYLKEHTDGPGLKEVLLTSLFTKPGIENREHQFSSIVTGFNATIGEFAVMTPRIFNTMPKYDEVVFDRKVGFNTRIVHWDGMTSGITWHFDSDTKTTYPKISGLDWTYIYNQFWKKIFYYIDKGKLTTLRMKVKPAFLSMFIRKINDVKAEGFRATYSVEIGRIKNYYACQKITSDGELAELELFLK